MKAKSGEGRQGGGFVEKVQVANRELLDNSLTDVKSGPLIFHTVTATNFYATSASFRLHTEQDEVRVSLYGQRFTETEKFPADFCKLAGVHAHCRTVLGLGDGQVLNIQTDQIQCELCSSLLLRILKNYLQTASIVLSHQRDAVTWVCQLHDFGQGCNINS